MLWAPSRPAPLLIHHHHYVSARVIERKIERERECLCVWVTRELHSFILRVVFARYDQATAKRIEMERCWRII